jgi:hypothetical protein
MKEIKMEWYKTLDINQRINLKEMTSLIGGVPWNVLILLFGFRDSIELIYLKLKKEGFEV